MVTLSEENYLKAIYHLGNNGLEVVSTNAIALKIDSKASSVTDMLKKLAEKGLVDYVKYQGVNLSGLGIQTAVAVIRKHRLWEVFLVNTLNFSWDEVHDIAEQLEHIKSDKLTNELEQFLNFPTHDPHGDPIPDINGKFVKTNKSVLSQVAINSKCICVGVIDSSAEFLKYLDKNNIAIGTHFKVIDKESFDNSMTIKTDEKTLVISNEISNNLYVKTN